MSTKKSVILSKEFPKILTKRKKLTINLQDTHGVQYARFMRQKTDALFIGEKIEKFCKDLKELGTEIINLEEKEMIPLTNEETKSYEKQKVYHICKKNFVMIKTKKKSRIIVITPENLEQLLIANAI